MTYGQVADIFSEVLGKQVEHVSLSEDELRKKLLAENFTEDMAEYMAKLDVRVAGGLGWEPTDTVKKVTGREPRTFKAFVEENKQIWL